MKNYPQEATRVRANKRKQLHGGERPEWGGQDSPSNRATANVRDISSIAVSGLVTGSEEGAFAQTTLYPKIMQQNSFNSNSSTVKHEPYLFDSFVLGSSSLPIQFPKASSPGLIQNRPPVNSSSQGSQNKRQCMIQKLLQEMMNNNNNNRAKELHELNGREEETSCGMNTRSTVGGLPKKARRTSVVRNELGCRDSINAAVASRAADVLGSSAGMDKGSKAASSIKSSGTTGNHCLVKMEPDLSVIEGVKDVAHGFCEDDAFNADKESMGYGRHNK